MIFWVLMGLGFLLFLYFLVCCFCKKGVNRQMESSNVRIILYQPDSVLAERTNVSDLSNYIRDIMRCYNEYISPKNYNNESSAIIVFAIKQNKKVKIWLIDNNFNVDNIELKELLMSIEVPDVNIGYVASAVYIGNIQELGVNLWENDVYLPNEWMEAINSIKAPVQIPDDVLDFIWAKE